jgi:hypothetical protein
MNKFSPTALNTVSIVLDVSDEKRPRSGLIAPSTTLNRRPHALNCSNGQSSQFRERASR